MNNRPELLIYFQFKEWYPSCYKKLEDNIVWDRE